MFPRVYPVWDSLCFLDLGDYFLSHVRKIFHYKLLKYFLRPFLFLLFFWDPYNSKVGVFNVVPEVSEAVLNSFHSFFFILLPGYYFHHFIFQLTYLFFCLSYSVIDSFQSIFFNNFFKLIYLLMAVLGLRFCARAFSSCGKRGPLFITVRRPLTIAASLVVEHRLQMRRLSNCGSRAQLLRGMWDLPRPGLELMSPALAGRFSTSAPPGNPQSIFNFSNCVVHHCLFAL